jgi:dihydroorotate dehydrogenase electron transfer subunit
MSAVAADPAVFDATVVACDPLGAYRILRFEAPALAGFQPGQFTTISVGGSHILRRPFSIYRADEDDVSIAFDAIGAGTEWLSECAPGETLNMVGPLGTGFPIAEAPGDVLLVGGGYGTAALVTLASRVAARGGRAHAVVGARTAARLFRDEDFERACASVTLVTDDGSAGTRGIVTDPLRALIEEHDIKRVYACGPNPMLAAVSKASTVESHLAVEEFMACGIGVCWTCVIPARVDGVVKHLRSCTDGPVFEGATLAWT